MYLRKRRSSELGEPEDVEAQLGELLADRLLVENTDDRVLAVHARHHRDAEVDGLARHAQLEAAVLRHALFGDVELRHDLDARDDRAVKALRNRPHRRLQHAVDAVLHVHRVVLRLDVNVAGAPLDGREDRRVDQPDDRTDVAREPLDGEIVFADLFVFEQLDLELFGRLVEHALRAFALLQDRLDRRARADHDAHMRAEQHRQLVDHRQVGRIRHDDDERLAVAPVRHEAVAQHQVGGNRRGTAPGRSGTGSCRGTRAGSARPAGAPVPPRRCAPRPRRRSARSSSVSAVGSSSSSVVRVVGAMSYREITVVMLNSGRYSDSTITAMTMPMMISSAGSITVTKRPTSVSISSS